MVGAALIAAFACPAQPAILVDRRPGDLRTRVVACSRDRPVVVRRARLRHGAGSRVVDVSGPGRRIGWGELEYAGRRVRAVVRLTRVQGGRPGRVRERVASAWRRKAPRLEVAVPARGDAIVWLVGRRVRSSDSLFEYSHLHDVPASGPLVLEDGVTARWWAPGGLVGIHDFQLRPRACGTRDRFHVVAESDQVVATAANYAAPGGGVVRVIRACAVAEPGESLEPLDRVVAQLRVRPGSGAALDVIAVRDDYAVLRRATGACAVEVYNAEFGVPAGEAQGLPCDRAPVRDTPLVIATGRPVWIIDGPGGSTLLAGAGTGAIVLDGAGPGGLTGLTADESVVRWLHDGEPRSMDFG